MILRRAVAPFSYETVVASLNGYLQPPALLRPALADSHRIPLNTISARFGEQLRLEIEDAVGTAIAVERDATRQLRIERKEQLAVLAG